MNDLNFISWQKRGSREVYVLMYDDASVEAARIELLCDALDEDLDFSLDDAEELTKRILKGVET